MNAPSPVLAPRSKAPGFTLVEVMISLAVLAFVLLAFLSIMTSASTLSMSSKEAMIASFELQSACEDVNSAPFGTFVQNGPCSYLLPGPGAPINPVSTTAIGPPPVPNNAVPYNVVYTGGPYIAGTNYSPFMPTNPLSAGNPVSTTGSPTITGGKYSALQNEVLTFTWTAMDLDNKPPSWAEYRVDITWTNFKGKVQTDSITTRRSR